MGTRTTLSFVFLGRFVTTGSVRACRRLLRSARDFSVDEAGGEGVATRLSELAALASSGAANVSGVGSIFPGTKAGDGSSMACGMCEWGLGLMEPDRFRATSRRHSPRRIRHRWASWHFLCGTIFESLRPWLSFDVDAVQDSSVG